MTLVGGASPTGCTSLLPFRYGRTRQLQGLSVAPVTYER